MSAPVLTGVLNERCGSAHGKGGTPDHRGPGVSARVGSRFAPLRHRVLDMVRVDNLLYFVKGFSPLSSRKIPHRSGGEFAA